jgi:hypothetical protein
MSLRLIRRPKSPNWVMRGTIRGIRIEESTGTGNRKLAEEIRAKREAELLAQSVYGRGATATFAEAALSYLENSGNKRFLAKVLRYFGTTPLAKIDQMPSTLVRARFTPMHRMPRGIASSIHRLRRC